MEQSFNIFSIPFAQLPKSILGKNFEAICLFIIRKKITQDINITSLQQQSFQNFPILLTIMDQFVVQLDSQTKQIISAFKCDFDIKFWILRAPSVANNILGKVQGVAFQFLSQPINTIISLFLEEQTNPEEVKNLQLFTSVLQKKYIVQKQFHEKYKAIKRIGKGVTACVYSALCLMDKSQVAIKSFKKQMYFNQDNGNGKKAFLKQFKILTELQSNYLSKLLGVYESDNSIYIVLQLLDRTLYNYLQKFNFPETTKCRRILYQLLIALRFLHKRNIMHRDIKLENIMIRGDVIVDFGLAQYADAQSYVYLRCGTPGYVAPEIINLSKQQKKTQIKYDKACDIFSMGVIFHILLMGKTVFQGEDVRQVVQNNKKCQIDYQFKRYPNVPPEIKDLLSGMLRKQPKQRYTVDQIMNHSFFGDQKIFFFNEVYQMDKNYFSDTKEEQSQSGMRLQQCT